MKTIVAVFTLVLSATSVSALANSKLELEAAIGKSLHAQAQQVKVELQQQTRHEQLLQLRKLRSAQTENTVLIADSREVVKPSRTSAE